MKHTIFFLCAFLPFLLPAQVPFADIQEQSQFTATARMDSLLPHWAAMDFSRESFIAEDYQIPAYQLYDREWSQTQLKSKDLDIPFFHGELTVILVGESNHPFLFPCRGQLTRSYGLQRRKEFHPGIDFTLQEQDQIYCCFDGVVRMAAEYGDYGNMVVVRHYNGLETVYARLGEIYVKPGQILSSSQLIGSPGSENGKGTLHFETRFMNEYFNPEILLDVENRSLRGNLLVLKEEELHFTKIPGSLPAEAKPEQEMPGTPKALPQEKENPLENRPLPAVKYHIVKKGETLYRISATYHVPVETLIRINNLPSNGSIREGEKLKIQNPE